MPAARTTSKPAPETPEAPAAEAVQAPEREVDIVAMPSTRADGSANQTSGYVSLLDEPAPSED